MSRLARILTAALATAPASIGGVRQMMRALKRGEAVGLLPDQVPPEGMGVWVPFFGKPAYTMTLAARDAEGRQRLTPLAERCRRGRVAASGQHRVALRWSGLLAAAWMAVRRRRKVLAADGVVYAEVRFAPELHVEQGLALQAEQGSARCDITVWPLRAARDDCVCQLRGRANIRGMTFATVNPATGKPLAEVTQGTSDDVATAVAYAIVWYCGRRLDAFPGAGLNVAQVAPVQVELREGHIVIITPITGTPSERAGLRRGDRLVKIDGKPVTVKFIEDPEENPTILNLIRYGLALKLDVGKLLSECLEPHLTEAKPKVAKTKKAK